MSTNTSAHIDNIARAAQLGEFMQLREHWQALYNALRDGGKIDDIDAYRLVAALDEAGTFDHLAGDQSADVRKIIADIIKAAETDNEDGITVGAAELQQRLASSPAPLRRDEADNLMIALRNARAFEPMTGIAEKLIARGQDHAKLRRLYAQALIDRGQVMAAIEILTTIVNSKGAPEDEINEAAGLLGRAHKQLFVQSAVTRSATRGDNLKNALEYYKRSARNRPMADAAWATVNVIALAKRGQSEGLPIAGSADVSLLASRLVKELQPKAERGDEPWDLATMGEAYVAQGDYKKAAHWFGRYGNHPKISAFQLAGTIRQLEEVWGIKADGSEAGQMLMAMKTRLLTKRGGQVTLTKEECVGVLTQPALPTSAVAQSILGQEGPVRFEWLALGMQRPPAIARICRRTGLAEGTGFRVDPNQLSSRLAALFPNELLLMTNIHVVSMGPHPSAMTPDEARIYFDHDAGPGERAHTCKTVWESPQHELDAALLSLDPPIRPNEVRACPLAEDRLFDQIKPRGDNADGRGSPSNVYIIGHPLGQRLFFSMHDTEVLDKGAPQGGKHEYLHYRTPTQRGHSGSPVFDDSDWRVVALHHAGSENSMIRRLSDPSKRHKANEGIAIRAIRRQVEAEFKNRKR